MSAADPAPKEPLSPAEIERMKDFMGDVPLDSGGAWERELAYMAEVLALPDGDEPLDLETLDERLAAEWARAEKK